MSLQEKIISGFPAMTKEAKETISNHLCERFQQNPAMSVEIGTIYAEKDNPVVIRNWRIDIIEHWLEEVKIWLTEEGFTVVRRTSPSGRFTGYKVYLRKDYAKSY